MGESTGQRRVVITGRGVISPIGCSTTDFWSSLLDGRSGVGQITSFDATDFPVRIGGEVLDFDPAEYMPYKVGRRIDRYAQYGLAAALQAVEEAKLVVEEEFAPRVGVFMGSGCGPSQMAQSCALALAERGHRAISPFASAALAIDCLAGEVALRIGACGPSSAISTACASGSTSIGEAMREIRSGAVDVMIAGGADSAITPVDMASFAMSKALSTRNDEPERASRPFDNARDGFVMSCGAGAVVLEEAEHALRRGAMIFGELIGYGSSTDAYHPTAPHPEGLGAKRAMRSAIEDARLCAEDIDYVNAHGTSTALNDRTEVKAIRAVLGGHATKIPISSTKSMTGHMIGAAGAVELIAAGKVVETGIVPPTINCDDPEDPELNYVPHQPQEHPVRVAMSNSFGFAGHNAVLIVRDWHA